MTGHAPPHGLPTMSNGYRTLSQHLNDLKKENFSLKLRIYFLEERMQQKYEASREDIYKRVSPDGGQGLGAGLGARRPARLCGLGCAESRGGGSQARTAHLQRMRPETSPCHLSGACFQPSCSMKRGSWIQSGPELGHLHFKTSPRADSEAGRSRGAQAAEQGPSSSGSVGAQNVTGGSGGGQRPRPFLLLENVVVVFQGDYANELSRHFQP